MRSGRPLLGITHPCRTVESTFKTELHQKKWVVVFHPMRDTLFLF
jgi:hypothetical protein